MVVRGAGIGIIARFGVRHVLAAAERIARIVSTAVAVIARDLWATYALACLALVAERARVPVVARPGPDLVSASGHRLAEVHRAGVAVIAVRCARSDARTADARVGHRAWVTVVARCSAVRVLAAKQWVAAISSTAVSVGAVEWRPGLAVPRGTLIANCTEVRVIAWSVAGRMLAPQLTVAPVAGARVVVVAIHPRSRPALAACTGVPLGTRVPVVTVSGHGIMSASLGFVAGVLGALIAVVTLDGHAGFAGSCFAVVSERARIVVVARARSGRELAAGLSVANVLGARIPIVARDRRSHT